jgi:glycosyltransferase involved in cell wall biosynthesis
MASRVSVLMPCFNHGAFISEAIGSVLAQTVQDFEIIVVDDGSQDATHEVAQSFGDRVRYVKQENAGVAAAVNRGISLARGRYFAWLSHDDLYAPEKLSQQLQALQAAGKPAVCYTDIKWIDEAGKVWDEKELPMPEKNMLVKAILLGEPVSFAAYSLMCDLSCFAQVGQYDVKKRHTQDADMLLRLARKFPFVHVPEKLTFIREHGTRDSYRPTFVAEANAFFREWLDSLTPAELSVNQSALDRAMARKKIADVFMKRGKPFAKLARYQYWKAITESALVLPAVASSFFMQFCRNEFNARRHFYRVGVRSYLRRRLAQH